MNIGNQNSISINQLKGDCLYAIICELSPKQVLECTEVSKEWHTFIFSAFPILTTIKNNRIKLIDIRNNAVEVNKYATQIKDNKFVSRGSPFSQLLRSCLNTAYDVSSGRLMMRLFNAPSTSISVMPKIFISALNFPCSLGIVCISELMKNYMPALCVATNCASINPTLAFGTGASLAVTYMIKKIIDPNIENELIQLMAELDKLHADNEETKHALIESIDKFHQLKFAHLSIDPS